MRIEIREIRNHNDKTTRILDDPTNGDMVKAMFPNIPIDEDDFLVRKSRFDNTAYWKDWWNAPYKEE